MTLLHRCRPSDMTTPYAQMLDNGVDFGAPDKRSVRLINSFSVSSEISAF